MLAEVYRVELQYRISSPRVTSAQPVCGMNIIYVFTITIIRITITELSLRLSETWRSKIIIETE